MCGILCICSSNLQGNVEANINCIEKVYHYIFTLSYPSSVFFGLIYHMPQSVLGCQTCHKYSLVLFGVRRNAIDNLIQFH